jgi:hypothetical protein
MGAMPRAAPPPPGALDATALEAIGGLLGVTPADIARARELFALMGDPGRRTVLERLSRQPERPGRSLPDVTGLDNPDIYHRLRSLMHGGVIVKNRHHIYSVDPVALNCASRYIDTLTAAASLTARSQPR